MEEQERDGGGGKFPISHSPHLPLSCEQVLDAGPRACAVRRAATKERGWWRQEERQKTMRDCESGPLGGMEGRARDLQSLLHCQSNFSLPSLYFVDSLAKMNPNCYLWRISTFINLVYASFSSFYSSLGLGFSGRVAAAFSRSSPFFLMVLGLLGQRRGSPTGLGFKVQSLTLCISRI